MIEQWDPRYEIMLNPIELDAPFEQLIGRLERRQAELNTPDGLLRRARRLEGMHRRGLDESLQQFAQRLGGPSADTEKYRHSWALQGLRFLGAVPVTEPWEETCGRIGDGARIAPGITVETREAKL